MAKSPNWSNEEVQLLKDSYPKLGKCDELQKLFPTRNLSAICLKANRIGLKVLNNIRIGRTNEEYIKLLENTNFECLESYKGSTVPIKHRCKICSHRWSTRPQHALTKNARCPICDLSNRKNSEEYIDNILDQAHMFRHSDYLGSLESLTLEHLDCGYIWETKFSYIQQGSGCPLCNKGFGFDYSKEALPSKAKLYLIKIQVGNEIFLKIGVTVRTINVRLRELRNKIKDSSIIVLKEYEDTGINILKKEQYILNKYTKYTTNLVFDGKTELLTIDQLDEILKEFN